MHRLPFQIPSPESIRLSSETAMEATMPPARTATSISRMASWTVGLAIDDDMAEIPIFK